MFERINYMDQSPSFKEPEKHYHVHKSLLLLNTLTWLETVRGLIPCLLKAHLKIPLGPTR
jgi:hypothetical protein